jgi:hypothetical protein
MDRFMRFKLLRALWARAKNLLAWLHGPRARDERLRAQYWQQVNSAQRYTRDGMIRGTGDPDSYVRPQSPTSAAANDSGWRAQWEAQRHWYEAQQRAQQQRRGR